MSYKILVTSDFERGAKKLNKKYPSFKEDLKNFLRSLETNPFQGVELYPGIRKIRLRIKSKVKGKSGGARVITYNFLIANDEENVVLVLIYDKSDFDSVDVNIVKEIITELLH